jgi:pimeloyl-ACP methyl ester carboxylesterase
LPIIYVRGFAGGSRGIGQAVDDPFYGFNLGSTHVRVGESGDPVLYQFESPLLRLVTEMGYSLLVEGGQEAYLDSKGSGEVPADSIWVHRFYDAAADTFGRRAEEFHLEHAAEDLLRLVEKVLDKTAAPRVHLVAHSMGGLICRSMIQRVAPERGLTASDLVDRLFTYGTPHGGIEFAVGFGLAEALRDDFGIAGGDIFGPQRMYEYLTPAVTRAETPPDTWDARDNPDENNFPTERIFCVVGTNAEDYAAALGMSARAVGVKSDGLVQTENALVTGANHAFVHRSHSGRYGLVNSEEGYQNLIRFLFGDVKVTADLVDLRLPDIETLTWQAETRVAVRGLPVLMHEQVAAHHCPILIEKPSTADPADRPVPLVTSFLWSARARAHGPMRYTIHVRLLSLKEHDRVFFWRDHLEQSTDFDDILVLDLEQQETGLVAWGRWASEIQVPLRDYQPSGEALVDLDEVVGTWRARIPFPAAGRFLGDAAALALTVRPST